MTAPALAALKMDAATFVSGQMLTDAKAQLNIVGADDDALIVAKLYAAVEWVSRYNGVHYFNAFYGKPAPDGSVTYTPDIPAPVYQAILQLVAHLYSDREGTQAIPVGITDALSPFRAWAF